MDNATRDRAVEVVLATAKIGGAILDTHEDALMTVLALEDAGIRLTTSSEDARGRGSSPITSWLRRTAELDLDMELDVNSVVSVMAVLREIDRRLGER